MTSAKGTGCYQIQTARGPPPQTHPRRHCHEKGCPRRAYPAPSNPATPRQATPIASPSPRTIPPQGLPPPPTGARAALALKSWGGDNAATSRPKSNTARRCSGEVRTRPPRSIRTGTWAAAAGAAAKTQSELPLSLIVLIFIITMRTCARGATRDAYASRIINVAVNACDFL